MCNSPLLEFITFRSYDDDDRIGNVCDEISSFRFYDDDDVKRHKKNYEAVMMI